MNFLTLFSFSFIIFSLIIIINGNTELDDNWTPLNYGECTVDWLDDAVRVGPPYTGNNENPLIAEGVGSGSVGNTCSFRKSGENEAYGNLGDNPIYKDRYLLAASQDLYAGRHLPVANSGNLNDLWVEDCKVEHLSKNQALNGRSCSQTCGVCFLVSGVEGSAVFMVNEIADVNAVGQNGEGLNLHLDDDHSLEVRDWNGVSKDISYKRVPCPTHDKGMNIYFAGNWGDNAIYLTIANHRNQLKSVSVRGSGSASDLEDVPLARDWINRWHYESYGCDSCPSWQNGEGPITRGSDDDRFQLVLTDIFDNEIVCADIKIEEAGKVVECKDEDGQKLQFPYPNICLSNCADDSQTFVNKDFYSDDDINSSDAVCSGDVTTTTAPETTTETTTTTQATTEFELDTHYIVYEVYSDSDCSIKIASGNIFGDVCQSSPISDNLYEFFACDGENGEFSLVESYTFQSIDCSGDYDIQQRQLPQSNQCTQRDDVYIKASCKTSKDTFGKKTRDIYDDDSCDKEIGEVRESQCFEEEGSVDQCLLDESTGYYISDRNCDDDSSAYTSSIQIVSLLLSLVLFILVGL